MVLDYVFAKMEVLRLEKVVRSELALYDSVLDNEVLLNSMAACCSAQDTYAFYEPNY